MLDAKNFLEQLWMRSRARRSPRIEAVLPIKIYRKDKMFHATATSINRHGMYIHTQLPTELNYVVQFEVDLPTGTMRGLATPKSRFVGSDGCGVEFFALDAGSRNLWETYYHEMRRSDEAARVDAGKDSDPTSSS